MSEFIESVALTPGQESQYMKDWLPLVRRVVRQLAPQADAVIDRDDMEQIALMGLLEALRRYGAPDEMFAGYAALRIRGAVLDELRLHDWRPRRLRQKTHKISDALRTLSRTLGREPQEEEIRLHLELSADEYQEYLQLDSAGTMESLDNLLAVGDFAPAALQGRALEDDVHTSRMLAYAISQLDSREQMILALYYQQELSLKEIALVLELTEARVCQLNKKISEKIRLCFN
ncbi:FliA/WhiG family RNA polymerase sigma factor [Rahnella sp. PD12R]|uniref:FliA/WhiG family RNA polymerase sigma factor n=1 Tax=Rahnella sp. PD12R TaxID=2855688 RepID=UPI001C444536|nr:FliA/WhiG family RNA polymerase sigma factor [Rahnella sp. PD12R]MBV6820096.1 FliA/WhiG family RNA polymerase sigma factor [Rahnella sp. PD12R]